jgi:hypothetical protein
MLRRKRGGVGSDCPLLTLCGAGSDPSEPVGEPKLDDLAKVDFIVRCRLSRTSTGASSLEPAKRFRPDFSCCETAVGLGLDALTSGTSLLPIVSEKLCFYEDVVLIGLRPRSFGMEDPAANECELLTSFHGSFRIFLLRFCLSALLLLLGGLRRCIKSSKTFKL